jgi:hypothetical protein
MTDQNVKRQPDATYLTGFDASAIAGGNDLYCGARALLTLALFGSISALVEMDGAVLAAKAIAKVCRCYPPRKCCGRI